MSSVAEIGKQQNNIHIVEIIGPAGAGKTSLYKALGNHSEQMLLSNFPDVHKIAAAPFYIRYGLQLIPSILRLSRSDSRQLTRREFAWLTIIKGWPFVLQKESRKLSQKIILDQGPVFLLADMREFGPDYLQTKKAEPLWDEFYHRWAHTLDMLVWLDAENINLVGRIRGRKQDHVVKKEPAEKAIEFLERYRKAFDFAVSALTSVNPGIRILRFDTSKQRTQDIEDRLLAEMGCS
jgi:deoxyadenosine/deoxycytidine kinase